MPPCRHIFINYKTKTLIYISYGNKSMWGGKQSQSAEEVLSGHLIYVTWYAYTKQ